MCLICSEAYDADLDRSISSSSKFFLEKVKSRSLKCMQKVAQRIGYTLLRLHGTLQDYTLNVFQCALGTERMSS